MSDFFGLGHINKDVKTVGASGKFSNNRRSTSSKQGWLSMHPALDGGAEGKIRLQFGYCSGSVRKRRLSMLREPFDNILAIVRVTIIKSNGIYHETVGYRTEILIWRSNYVLRLSTHNQETLACLIFTGELVDVVRDA
jgi:hypothetical protein